MKIQKCNTLGVFEMETTVFCQAIILGAIALVIIGIYISCFVCSWKRRRKNEKEIAKRRWT